MSFTTSKTIMATITLLFFFLFPTFAEADVADSCDINIQGKCYDKPEALKLKIISIAAILIASMLGVCLPLFSRYVPALHPDRNLFVVVKAFASGVILATGYMHVFPDSFDKLTSPCLPQRPWHEFPFTTFVAMLAALLTLMVDSYMMMFYRKKQSKGPIDAVVSDSESQAVVIPNVGEHGHGHFDAIEDGKQGKEEAVHRNRVIAQVLEMGIIVHSVVIGLALGASQNPCTIRPLIAALCFHQMFEGMGLGGCILQAEYGLKMKAILSFFFSTTTPFGIALGIGLSNVYSDNSPTALIVEGVLNAMSAGLLNYMALVDLLAADFMGPKLQSNGKLQGIAYVAVLMGAGLMSLMAKWA